MKFGFLLCLMLAVTAIKSQSLSIETLAMKNGISALVSFDTPLFKSEKISFSQTGRFGIDYDGENPLVFMMSNFGYQWSSSFKSTAGALYLGQDKIAPTIGFQAITAKKNRLLLVYPIVALQNNSQLWLISVAQFEKPWEKYTGILGLTSLQLFTNEGHIITVGILHLGLQKNKLQFGLASYLNFIGNQFDFEFNPGVYLKYKLF